MKLKTQRKIDKIVGTVLCGIFSLGYKFKRKVSVPEAPPNILVILLSEMGSLVLARPMFEHIKSKYPDARLYVLLLEKNREVLDVLGVVPGSNILTVNDRSLSGFICDSLKVFKKLRLFKIDCVIDCELFSRVSSIFSYMSDASIKVGFQPFTQEGLYRGSFINRPVLYNPYQHISQQFVTLVEAIDSSGVPTVKRTVPKTLARLSPIEVDKDELRRFKRRFEKDFPQIKGKKLILLYPSGGLLAIRAWPLRYFFYTCKELLKKGYAVGIIGMESDKPIAEELWSYSASPFCIDLTGYTKTVKELILLFNIAALLITNDGGPGHFASLTPIPSIIFFGPETPSLYGPLDDKSFVFYSNLSCSPCLTAYNHRNTPCNGDNKCLKCIKPKDVLHKAYEILENQNY